VLAASIRTPVHLLRAAEAGAHVATIPFGVMKQMLHHPLTDAGLEKFLADWRATKQKI
jgi:transaldolase